MRTLLLLLAGAASVAAAEPRADPVTLHLPADALFVVRFAPPDRWDAIGRELKSLEDLMGPRRTLGSELLAMFNQLRRLPVDRSGPLYLAAGPSGSVVLARAAAGTTAERLVTPRNRRVELLEDGWLRVGRPERGRLREVALPLLRGDLSLVCPLNEVTARYREEIEEARRNLGRMRTIAAAQRVPVPPAVFRLFESVGDRVLRAASDLEDVHYALTWKSPRLESEGWIRTRENSSLHAWLAGLGGGKPHELMRYLPENAFYMVESCGLASKLDGDVAALLDEAFGEGAGDALLLLLTPGYALHDHLTGRAAGTVSIQGMMAMSMRSIYEVAPDAAIEAAIEKLDADRLNRLLATLQLPIEVTLERDFARSGSTPLHRLRLRTDEPQLLMFISQLETCFAVEGGHLLVVQSGFAESELRGLIDRVRSGPAAGHPHEAAMQRLMPTRAEGLTLNFGALKPMLGMLAVATPESARALQAVPDRLYFSTALEIRGKDVHLRGDWPLEECVELAAKIVQLLR